MRDDTAVGGGVTYIGPRTLVAGLVGLCAIFGAIIYSAPKIIDALEPAAPPASIAGVQATDPERVIGAAQSVAPPLSPTRSSATTLASAGPTPAAEGSVANAAHTVVGAPAQQRAPKVRAAQPAVMVTSPQPAVFVPRPHPPRDAPRPHPSRDAPGSASPQSSVHAPVDARLAAIPSPVPAAASAHSFRLQPPAGRTTGVSRPRPPVAVTPRPQPPVAVIAPSRAPALVPRHANAPLLVAPKALATVPAGNRLAPRENGAPLVIAPIDQRQ